MTLQLSTLKKVLRGNMGLLLSKSGEFELDGSTEEPGLKVEVKNDGHQGWTVNPSGKAVPVMIYSPVPQDQSKVIQQKMTECYDADRMPNVSMITINPDHNGEISICVITDKTIFENGHEIHVYTS